jgi:uncharacterized protein YkwD
VKAALTGLLLGALLSCPMEQAAAVSANVQFSFTVLPAGGGGGPDMFQQQLLDLINTSRAGGGLPPYTFSEVMSAGTGSCVGSVGHSEHMAQTGTLAHDQFPADICVPWISAGENIGYWSGVSESQAIINIHNSMMAEGPSGGHYQNIMSSTFTTVGLGLVVDANGTTWLTEDFVDP